VNEFLLIDQIVAALGEVAAGACVRIGPGDDAAVSTVPRGMELVSSIDALVADVHFPAEAGPALIGYRAIMVSASDLAAMGAAGGFILVALNLPEGNPDWAAELARGMAEAAAELGLSVVGGNIAAGPLAITVSVHGFAPAGQALTRAGARIGDGVFVTGRLGGAAAAVARGDLASCQSPGDLDLLSRHYFHPQARIPEGVQLLGLASSAIDLSDGLLQDLSHIGERSGVGFDLESTTIPVETGATLAQALSGGDDYELCFTMATAPPPLDVAVHRIGQVVSNPGIRLDGKPVNASGYQHFAP
jgi:thiamine-monophosphate kinase